MLTDTAGGGGGNQDGLEGQFCNGSFMREFWNYPDPPDTILDAVDDSSQYWVEVRRIPGSNPTCESYTLTVSNGPLGFLQSVIVTGNLAPNEDSDWFTFFGADDPEGDTTMDSYRVSIEISNDPGFKYYIHVYKNDIINRQCAFLP